MVIMSFISTSKAGPGDPPKIDSLIVTPPVPPTPDTVHHPVPPVPPAPDTIHHPVPVPPTPDTTGHHPPVPPVTPPVTPAPDTVHHPVPVPPDTTGHHPPVPPVNPPVPPAPDTIHHPVPPVPPAPDTIHHPVPPVPPAPDTTVHHPVPPVPHVHTRIFPNPSNTGEGSLFIDASPADIFTLKVYNSTAVLILSQSVNGGSTLLPSALTSGIYYYIIINSNGKEVSRGRVMIN
jgi:hypothetical protein